MRSWRPCSTNLWGVVTIWLQNKALWELDEETYVSWVLSEIIPMPKKKKHALSWNSFLRLRTEFRPACVKAWSIATWMNCVAIAKREKENLYLIGILNESQVNQYVIWYQQDSVQAFPWVGLGTVSREGHGVEKQFLTKPIKAHGCAYADPPPVVSFEACLWCYKRYRAL